MMVEDKRKQNSQKILILGLSGCLILLTCLFLLGAGALAGFYFSSRDDEPFQESYIAEIQPNIPAVTPTVLPPPDSAAAPVPTATSSASPLQPTPTLIPISTPMPEATSPPSSKLALDLPAALDQQPISERANADLQSLYQMDFPENDYYTAAISLGGFAVGTRTVYRPEFQIGDRQVFHTEEGNVEATLIDITDHTFIWVDDATYLPEAQVKAAAQRLEDEFYPRINHLFDQPWTPGVDGIDRFSILHLSGSGNEFELGYFSDQDEFPRTLFPDSNEQEIVYLNMDQLEIGSDLYFGTLIHELQHLFQWNLDKNEATWLNEGLSQLAEKYAGLDTANPEAYLDQPDTRLNSWEYDEEIVDAHYANSYLFSVYLWEQLGEMGVYELVRQPANGLAAVDLILKGFKPQLNLEQFLANWAAANYLDDPAAGEQYAYDNLVLDRPSFQTRIRQLPFSDFLELDQFAVHYIDLDYSGPLQLTFAGDTNAKLIDSPPAGGDMMWYVPPANDTHAQLTARFDLRQLNQAALEFDAWYDLEEDFDFAYVSVSEDQGASWRILSPHLWSSGYYGPGFSGSSAVAVNKSNGWVHERISLDNFAGKEILIRFHVLTDFESLGRGFALDNISIPELNYLHDAETTDDQWQGNGFVRTGWQLPQRWAVQVINHGPTPTITSIQLDALNQTQQIVNLGPDGGALVVMPMTPFVDETARYWIQAKN